MLILPGVAVKCYFTGRPPLQRSDLANMISTSDDASTEVGEKPKGRAVVPRQITRSCARSPDGHSSHRAERLQGESVGVARRRLVPTSDCEGESRPPRTVRHRRAIRLVARFSPPDRAHTGCRARTRSHRQGAEHDLSLTLDRGCPSHQTCPAGIGGGAESCLGHFSTARPRGRRARCPVAGGWDDRGASGHPKERSPGDVPVSATHRWSAAIFDG
jgi:hypothetical protein